MSKLSFIVNNYFKNNLKNIPYYVIIFCIKICSLGMLLSILFINFYYESKISNNSINKTYIVNIGNYSKENAKKIFLNSSFINEFNEIDVNYNSKHELINTSFEIKINDIKNANFFIKEMNNHNFEVIVSNDNILSQTSLRVLMFFSIALIVVCLIILIIFIHIITNFFKRESNNLKILHFLGYNKKYLFQIILKFIYKLNFYNLLAQLLVLIFLFINFEIFSLFFYKKYLSIFIIFLTNNLIYFIISIILLKSLIRKYIN